ncbi:helix-turn-helix domain-containing protein [Aliivibrio fischeri]|uniref:Helix-turn-helix domain-containing protein n=1 Tax=Aliivibrio fischeri TaxID=668 RepID=A0A844P5V8_ALIFS|nr:helix-turn-helix transcriptional regulator [Aliivibrio fischeri]MUK50774.1 helix-turn-helix domain-containing protein [Aliivibrio fischeri]
MLFNNPLPQRLKEARKKAKLSQKALGVRIGMDESTASPRMNQYEKGKHTPDVQTLKLIAAELNVPLNYFFCESQSSAKLACIIDKMTENEKKELIEYMSKLKLDAKNK